MAAGLSCKVKNALLEKCGIGRGGHLLVAVSGGADSVALLHLLLGLVGVLDLRLTAAHLDHALREESADDAAFVSRLCESWRVPLVTERIDVRAVSRQLRTGIEDGARKARMQFLQDEAKRNGCSAIALAHHRQDQAETVLHRLLRGTGNRGLAAMAWRRDGFIRPLLDIEPTDLRSYLEKEQIPWREDPSNRDLSLTRNRIRHEVIPLLQHLNPRVDAALAGLAERSAVDEDYWRRQTESVADKVISLAGEALCVDLDQFAELHPALQIRLLQTAIFRVRGEEKGLSAYHLDELLDQLGRSRSQWNLDLPGCWVGRRYRSLWLQQAAPPTMERYRVEIPGPGTYDLPCGGQFSIETGLGRSDDQWSVALSSAKVSYPLTVRNALPGDRFRPSGMLGSMKLKDFFINEKVSLEARSRLPLLVGEEPIWVAGLRLAEGYRATDQDEPVRVAFRPPDDWTFLL